MANKNFGHWNSTQRYILPATLRHLLIFAHEIPSFQWKWMFPKNSGTPKSSILIGFSIIFTIHFGVPVFLETPNDVCPTTLFPFFARISSTRKVIYLQPSFPLSSLKKGILLREVKWPSLFFQLATSPQKKIMYIPAQWNLYILISPIAPSTSSTIHPKPFFFGGSGIESFSWRERRRWRVDPGFFCWAGKAFDSCRVVGFFGPFTVRSSKVMTGDGSRNVPLFLKVSWW